MRICSSSDIVEVEVELRSQWHLYQSYIIDVCRYFVHAVAGVGCNDIVNSRIAECTDDQIYGLIGAISQKYIIEGNTLDLTYFFLDHFLQWVGVSVVGGVVWIFVGVNVNVCLTGKFIPRRTIRLEPFDVFS